MSVRKISDVLSAFAGWLVAPVVWAINMQLGQILPYVDCRQQSHRLAIISFVGVVAVVLAGFVSWRWADQARVATPLTATSRFIAWSGALSALVFAFALSAQGIASLVLSGCER